MGSGNPTQPLLARESKLPCAPQGAHSAPATAREFIRRYLFVNAGGQAPLSHFPDVRAGTAHKSVRCRPCRRSEQSSRIGTVMEDSAEFRYLLTTAQGPVLHEAPSRPRDHAEVGLASGPPDSGDLARGTGALRGPRRSRRGLHRREEEEHEPGQEKGNGRPRTRRKDDDRRRQGPGDRRDQRHRPTGLGAPSGSSSGKRWCRGDSDAYSALPDMRATVREYVRGQVTRTASAFWPCKRGMSAPITGVADEFAGRHNNRPALRVPGAGIATPLKLPCAPRRAAASSDSSLPFCERGGKPQRTEFHTFTWFPGHPPAANKFAAIVFARSGHRHRLRREPHGDPGAERSGRNGSGAPVFTPPPGGLASIAPRSGAKLPSPFPDGAAGNEDGATPPTRPHGGSPSPVRPRESARVAAGVSRLRR